MANLLTFDTARCKGCQLCVSVCPKNILELDMSRVNSKGYNPIMCRDMSACIACAMCARICPDSVIKVEKDVLGEG
ncbi:MAG: 4Fe-4S binding protein [Defluviitaleaceae bacterium]|nr:4Fe-4S binding protein [Defluviitaleaceae bacterium]